MKDKGKLIIAVLCLAVAGVVIAFSQGWIGGGGGAAKTTSQKGTTQSTSATPDADVQTADAPLVKDKN